MFLHRPSVWTRKPHLRSSLLRLDESNPLVDGLVGCYLLGQDPSTETLFDLAGNNNGTHAGPDSSTISQAQWEGGRWSLFTATNTANRLDLGSIDSSNPLSLSSDVFTIMYRARMIESAAGNSFPRVIDKSNSGNASAGWGVWMDRPSNEIDVGIAGGVRASRSYTSAQEDGTLTPIVTKDTSDLKVYLSATDTSPGTNASAPAVPSTTTNAAIGNWNHSNDREWAGYIDFVYIWNKVLTREELISVDRSPYQFVLPRPTRTYHFLGAPLEEAAPVVTGSGRPIVVVVST